MRVNDNTQIAAADRDFRVLLRAGLWQRVEEELSSAPDWAYIYQLASEQTVQGIVTDGMGLYCAQHPECRVTPELQSKLMAQTAQIVRKNHTINQQQQRLCKMLQEEGGDCPYVILKGQGVAQSYAKPMIRCSGDIDFFFTEDNYEKAKALFMPLASKVEDKPLTLECALEIEGVQVELHGAMSAGINKHCNRHLQSILHKVLHEGDTRTITIGGQDIMLPSANFDALYILIHTIRHLGAFGISLRQVIDWAMHMHANAHLIDRDRLQRDIETMHLQKLWNLFSSFAVEYLGAPREDFLWGSGSSNGSNSSMGDELERTSGKLPALWQIIRASGSFGHNNPYFEHLHAGKLNERYFRIHYHVKQALAMRQFDTEFSGFLLRKELQDIVKSPFRFLFGGKTKITE